MTAADIYMRGQNKPEMTVDASKLMGRMIEAAKANTEAAQKEEQKRLEALAKARGKPITAK